MNHTPILPQEETLLTGINVSSEFDLKKIKWARIRQGNPKPKTKGHKALEKSIIPLLNPLVQS